MDITATTIERIRELQYAIRFYEDREWDDLAKEYRARLDELQRLVKSMEPPTQPPLTEGEARVMAGNR